MTKATKDETYETKAKYARIMKRSLAKTPAEFNAAVASRLLDHNITPAEADPKDWLKAAAITGFKCRRCAGTGQFITMVKNGKPTGPGGICYRCNGKGWQNDADRRRNFGYDNHALAEAAHAMVNDATPAQEPDANACDNCGDPATTHWNEGHGQKTPYCEECWVGRADGESQMAMEA